jgi:mono/diheme cytochrome c family protein
MPSSPLNKPILAAAGPWTRWLREPEPLSRLGHVPVHPPSAYRQYASVARLATGPNSSPSPTEQLVQRAARPLIAIALLSLVVGAIIGCDSGLPAGRTPHREFNFLDMGDQPKLKPQRADLFGARPTGLLAPPMGAVAVDETVYPFSLNQGQEAGAALSNPLPASDRVRAHGKFVYENVCITCHGPQAAGDGTLIQVFPRPPSLMSRKIRDWPDGSIFHVPMRGQGSMPSHATQISQSDIWAVVHHIRQLQSELPVAPTPDATAVKEGEQP